MVTVMVEKESAALIGGEELDDGSGGAMLMGCPGMERLASLNATANGCKTTSNFHPLYADIWKPRTRGRLRTRWPCGSFHNHPGMRAATSAMEKRSVADIAGSRLENFPPPVRRRTMRI